MDSTGGAVTFQQVLDFKSCHILAREGEKMNIFLNFWIVVGTKTPQRVINVFMLRLISVSWQKGRLRWKSFGQIGKNTFPVSSWHGVMVLFHTSCMCAFSKMEELAWKKKRDYRRALAPRAIMWLRLNQVRSHSFVKSRFPFKILAIFRSVSTFHLLLDKSLHPLMRTLVTADLSIFICIYMTFD